MHELNIVDNSFDLKNASDYHISIQLGLDGFSFCILDIRRNKYVVFRHIPLIVGKLQFLTRKIETIFEQEENLHATFRSVLITYSTEKSTLIPKDYPEPEFYLKVAGLTNEIKRNEEVRAENLTGTSYQIIYSYPKELMTLLNRKFTDFQFKHKSIPLLVSIIDQRDVKKKTILINFEKKYIRMIAFTGSQVSLYNSFNYKNESDFLYFTLHICQGIHFNPELDEILIGGYVADDSSYIRQLNKYISHVGFMKPYEDFDYGNIFEKIQKHQFISLLNSYTCV